MKIIFFKSFKKNVLSFGVFGYADRYLNLGVWPHPSKKGVRGMTLNFSWLWSFNSGNPVSVD